MNLHEAITKVFQQYGKQLTLREIADILNKNGWYVKRDKSLIQPNQISARISKHPEIFSHDNTGVWLK
jgi:hypothetical protein